jgi:1-hydroxycarotenoid 3,4-desaturase
LEVFGLSIEHRPNAVIRTVPKDFQRLFPATGGALYGPASHGWMASFTRAGSRTAVRGLYLAGGSSHPGPGLPMAATSGRLAAAALLKDFASTTSFRTAAMRGGMSMR